MSAVLRALWISLTLCACGAVAAQQPQQSAPAPADTVYRNGFIYTVDAHDSVFEALAIRAGRIVYVGSDADLGLFAGAKTRTIDVHGRMVMPGLVDGHMHPLDGGARRAQDPAPWMSGSRFRPQCIADSRGRYCTG